MNSISSTNTAMKASKRFYPSRVLLMSHILLVGGLLTSITAQAATMDLTVTNVAGFPAAGIAFYDANGLVGDIYAETLSSLGIPDFTGPALTMPGPGPVTDQLPKVAALFQFAVDPNTITPGDLAPSLHPDQKYSYNFTGYFTIAGRDGVFPLNFNYPISFTFNATANSLLGNPGWILVDSNNHKETWVHYGLTSLTAGGGEGFLTFATTDSSPISDYLYPSPQNGAINGGHVIVTTVAVPEVSSFSMLASSTVLFASFFSAFSRRARANSSH